MSPSLGSDCGRKPTLGVARHCGLRLGLGRLGGRRIRKARDNRRLRRRRWPGSRRLGLRLGGRCGTWRLGDAGARLDHRLVRLSCLDPHGSLGGAGGARLGGCRLLARDLALCGGLLGRGGLGSLLARSLGLWPGIGLDLRRSNVRSAQGRVALHVGTGAGHRAKRALVDDECFERLRWTGNDLRGDDTPHARGRRRCGGDGSLHGTNATIEALLGRRSIRKFKDEAIDDDTRATLETVAQHAASSQFLNDWSAIRITDPAIKAKLAEFGHQPYIATAPLLYVFVIDEHRNARIAERKGIDPASDEFHLKYSYRFTQAQNDAVLALHAMETAAYSLGLGCVILGSLLNNIPGLIDVLNLPEYTYPVLGLAIGKPDQNPTVKPRMPRTMQFFENTYPADADGVLDQLPAFDEEVHRYYDLRQADRPVDAFSDQVVTISRQDVSHQTLLDKAAAQGFRLD